MEAFACLDSEQETQGNRFAFETSDLGKPVKMAVFGCPGAATVLGCWSMMFRHIQD